MKFKISREWCEQQARQEDGCEIGAGALAMSPVMRFKSIKWDEPKDHPPVAVSGDKGGVGVESEDTIVGRFSVGSFDGGKSFLAFFRWQKIGDKYPSLEEAKAACQADFERRVLSCLESEDD